MASRNATQQLIKTYSDRRYKYATTLSHRGAVVAFAMDEERRIHYAVLDMNSPNAEAGAFDVANWPHDPTPLRFSNEIEQVGYSVTGATAMPLVKKGSRIEAEPGSLWPEEIDSFLSTTARLSADVPFHVFSDQKHVFVFRQAIASDHPDTVHKLSTGAASGDAARADSDFILDDGSRVPLVNNTLLCDRFVLAGAALQPKREVRYRRSRHRTTPASGTDALGASDMEGVPFFEPTQELAFVHSLRDGQFTALQLPTQVQGVKRWQLFAYSGSSRRLNSFNVEVSDDGLFNTQGTQLYTSPDAEFRSAVLERQPGTCALSGRPLVPVTGEQNFAETALRLGGAGAHVRVDIEPWTASEFCVEVWVHPAVTAQEGDVAAFSSADNSTDSFQIDIHEGRWCFFQQKLDSVIDIAEVKSEWQHLAVTYDGTHIRSYANGDLVSEVARPDLSVVFTTYKLGLNRAGTDSFHGSIDEARVWNRSRSAHDIRAYMGHRLVGDEASLVGYWRLDEGSGTAIYDQSNNGHHGTIVGDDVAWVASDAPLGDHPGMRRSSVGFAGRVIAGGFDAQLYFQQEAARAGYSQEDKPFKKAARVLLSVNTTDTDGSDPAMAMLDVGIARDGRLGLMPDTLDLPRLDRPTADIDINAVAEAKRNVEVVQTQVERLQTTVDEFVKGTKALPFAIQERDALQAQIDAKQTKLDNPLLWRGRLELFFHNFGLFSSSSSSYWTTLGYRAQGNTITSMQMLTNPEGSNVSDFAAHWIFVKRADGTYKIHADVDKRYCINFSGSGSYALARDSGTSADHQYWRAIPHNDRYTVAGHADVRFAICSFQRGDLCLGISSTHRHEPTNQSLCSTWQSSGSTYWRTLYFKVDANNPERLADIAIVEDLRAQHEAKRLEVITLDNQAVELDALRAELSTKQTELTTLRMEIAALEGGAQRDLRLGMEQLHTDPRGLTLCGGLLTFMVGEHAPRLHESANGRVSCYYRADSGQLMVGYYDAQVQRAQWELTVEGGETMLLQSRLPSARSDSTTISVADGGDASTCEITIDNGELGIRETWAEVPRTISDAVEILRGIHESYDYTQAIAEPADKTLRAGSLLLQPVQGPLTAALSNGVATLVRCGQSSQWIGDAPGHSYYFNGGAHALMAPPERIDDAALSDDFTLEVWTNPLLNHKPAHIVHQRDSRSGYVLGLEPALIRAALQLNGSDEYVHAPVLPWQSKTFTVELWAKPNAVRQPSAPGLFSSVDATEPTDAVHLGLTADGEYQLTSPAGSTTFGAATPSWQHLAVSYDGNTLRAYLDAKLVVEVQDADRVYHFQAYLLGTNIARDGLFAGQLDEPRVWNYARSQHELSAARLSRLSGDEPGLTGCYRFGLTQAEDLTAHTQHGTYHGTPALVTAYSGLQGFRVIAGVGRARQEATTEDSLPQLQTRQFIRSQEVLTQHQWHHLALRFHQSYALQLAGQGGVTVPNDPALNLCDDLTIEVFVYLPGFSGTQTLISKGSTGMGDDQSLPYALHITGAGYLQAQIEEPSGAVHTFASSTALLPGFHRIALVRRGGTSRRTSSKSQTYTFTDDDGNQHNVPVDMIDGVDTDEWQDLTFYVDGREIGRHRHHGEKAMGNDGALTLGTAGQRQHLIGTLSEVRIWSTARDAKELGRPIRGGEKHLTAWWAFEEKRGNVAYEHRGNYHGQLVRVRHVQSPDPVGSTLELAHNGLPLTADPLPNSDAWMAAETWLDSQFTVGAQQRSGELLHGFTGSLEELRLWRERRTPEQLMDNLFDRIKEEKQDLLAYYTFDETSTAPSATHLQDNSLRGLHLVWESEETKPRVGISDAPINQDAPSVRSALAGVHTAFHQIIDGRLGVEEYGDLQRDAQGETFGVLKRAYAYIQDGHWVLFTGYKVGSLMSEWIGQAQFDPQVVGYIEGIPPVPSENLTAGQMNPSTMNWADFGDMASMEFLESEEVSYSLGSTTETSNSVAFDASVKANFDNDFMISVAPFGFGSIFKALEVEANASVSGHFESGGGWSNEASLGTSLSRSRGLSVSMGGSWESPDSAEHLNPDLGRRLMPGNVGFALVQSETADVFALRLAHNQRLVSFRMMPNPDIPKDWNLVSFPINPRYSKQGSLDGRVGYDANGAVVYDPDYQNAAGYGEYSYYKPREAYAIKRRIRQAEQDRLHYFETLGQGRSRGGGLGESAGKAASQLLKDNYPDAAKLMEQAQAGTGNRDPSRELPARHARRDLANTYVWTADGGFYSETTATTDVRTETASGSFDFSSSTGASMGLDIKVFGVGVGMEFEAAMGGGLSSSRTRTKQSEKTFEINLNLDVPGDLQRYRENANGEWVADGNNFPGKVDAYRFMTFYLDAAKENFEDLFGKVVDPIWLAQSDAPNAAALRQANQKGKRPACWRIFHRVTFVSRILPEFADPTSAPLEAAMQEQDLSSNWQLIQRLEPFVKNKTADAVTFADAVRTALARELPELSPHADTVVQFLEQYYGVA